jgi:hypothetical protein
MALPKAIIISDLESHVLDVDAPIARVAWDQQYSRMADFTEVTKKQ